MINGDHQTLNNLSKEFTNLSKLNADYLLILLGKESRSVLPIYSIIPSVNYEEEYLKNFIKKMHSSILNQMSNNKSFFADWRFSDTWILIGNWSGEKLIHKTTKLDQRINSWLDEVNPDFRYWNQDQDKYLKVVQNFLKI